MNATRGKFVLSDKGTLFLDEIGDLALPAQAKLLRAIQEGKIQPLGAERTITVDVRIVSATHKDLWAEAERAAINAEEPYVDACDLSPRLGAAASKAGEARGQSLAERFATLEPTEKQLVEEALSLAKGNISEAGRLLGISRQMIRRRVERFGFEAKEDS